MTRPARPADDAYWTPPEATRALLSVEAFAGVIWEPCAGGGWMAEVLREAGHKVRATTLLDDVDDDERPLRWVRGGIDFLADDPGDDWPICNIVTNPPYRHAEACIRRAIDLGAVKTCMLLDISFLGSQRRGAGLFADHPPARVWVMSSRVTMYPAGYEGPRGATTQTHAWFVWERSRTGSPVIGWINPADFR